MVSLMELAKTKSLKTRDQLLSAVKPDCLGLIWSFGPDDKNSDIFNWLDFLTSGLLYKQKDHIFGQEKSYIVCRFFDKDFHLTLIPRHHEKMTESIEHNLSLITSKDSDTRKKIITIDLASEHRKKLKKKHPSYSFHELLM
jgi:hypothetical protein